MSLINACQTKGFRKFALKAMIRGVIVRHVRDVHAIA